MDFGLYSKEGEREVERRERYNSNEGLNTREKSETNYIAEINIGSSECIIKLGEMSLFRILCLKPKLEYYKKCHD